MTGVLCMEVVCGGAAHTVAVHVEGHGREQCVLVDHDEELDGVLEWLGQERSACRAAAEAVDALQRAVPSASSRIRWISAGVHDERTLDAWKRIGATTPARVRRWTAALAGRSHRRKGGTRPHRQAIRWHREGFTRPEEVGAWITAGLGAGEARKWADAGLSVADARAWLGVGVKDHVEVVAWRRANVIRPGSRAPWAAIGVH